ncbi:hypothetical protein [Agrobacterium vitis]|nr:hypothetical protein [Agrobacterium vitis]
MLSEEEIDVIIQAAPTSWIRPPKLEVMLANQIVRKIWFLKGANDDFLSGTVFRSIGCRLGWAMKGSRPRGDSLVAQPNPLKPRKQSLFGQNELTSAFEGDWIDFSEMLALLALRAYTAFKFLIAR